jgi:hypothetical protein
MEKAQPTPKKSPLIFSTRSYPTFGRERKPFNENNPPQTVLDSPYYWWFMFLRLNADYKATCKAKGKGKCAELYKDFGDVHKVNFKEWWKERAHLFAEPKKGYRMMVANNIKEIAPFDDEEVLNLVVPLAWSQRSLKKAFTSLVLNKVEKGKKGVSLEKSEAKYPLGSKWHIEALKTAYKIYVEKNKETNGEKVAWADIAIRVRLPMAIGVKEKNLSKQTSDIRRTLTILAKRHYSRAEAFIKASATSKFPK